MPNEAMIGAMSSDFVGPSRRESLTTGRCFSISHNESKDANKKSSQSTT